METLSIKVHEATRDAIEGLRVTGGRIVSASAVGRRLIEQALAMNGGRPVVLPALDFEPDDLETVRYALEHDEKIHASRSRALLEFYDEVCAMLGQHPVPSYKVNREGYAPPAEPKNAAGFTAAEQAEIDDYAAKAQAEAAAKVVPIAAGSRPKYAVAGQVAK